MEKLKEAFAELKRILEEGYHTKGANLDLLYAQWAHTYHIMNEALDKHPASSDQKALLQQFADLYKELSEDEAAVVAHFPKGELDESTLSLRVLMAKKLMEEERKKFLKKGRKIGHFDQSFKLFYFITNS